MGSIPTIRNKLIRLMIKTQNAHITLSRIRGYFCRKGKTENLENNLSKIFINNLDKTAKIRF